MKTRKSKGRKPGQETVIQKISPQMAALIPYTSFVKEGSLIELEAGLFSKTACIKILPYGDGEDNALSERLRQLIESCPAGINVQLSMHRDGSKEEFYLTASYRATEIKEAVSILTVFFSEANENCINLAIPARLEPLSLQQTLELIHKCYLIDSKLPCPNKGSDQEVTYLSLKKAHMTTKDLVAPETLSFDKDLVRTNDSLCRIYTLNSYSWNGEPGFLRQLILPLERSITAVHLSLLDPATSQNEPEEMMLTTDSADQRQSNVQTGKKPSAVYQSDETLRMKRTMSAMQKNAFDQHLRVCCTTVLVAVRAQNEELLDMDCHQLQSAVSKSGLCKLLPLDYQQKEALSGILPLAVPKCPVTRTFLSPSAVCFLPFPFCEGLTQSFEVALPGQNSFESPQRQRIEKVKTGDQFKVKRTVQETIPYIAAYPGEGIIETVPGLYTRMYRFSDINYRTATEEDQTSLLIKYSQLLNRFDSSIRCQIVLNNKNVDMKEFKQDTLLMMKEDDLDIYRKEYNDIILSKMAEGRNNLKKECYLVIAVEAETLDLAKHSFARLDPEIISAFKEIGGSRAEPVSTMERLEILYDIYNIGNEGSFLTGIPAKRRGRLSSGGDEDATRLETLSAMGIHTKDLIAPSSFCFMRDYFVMGSKYCRILYLMDLPNVLSDDLVSDLASVNCNLVLSMNLEIIRQDKAVKMVKHQMLTINSTMQQAQQTASKNGYSMELVPVELQQAQEEANELLRNLTGRNQKMFRMTFTVLLIAGSMQELKSNTDMVVIAGRKHLCNLKKLNYQQEDGLNATLPFCFNRLSVKRTLTTDSTIIFSPFDTQELIQKHGMYYGQNASSHNLILFDRDSTQNGNGWILGTSGAGKSFCAKREMANVFLNTQDDILIIDPEREYSPLVKAFGGSIVRIAPGSKYHLNPLDMDKDYADDDDPIVLKSDLVLSLCECLIGGRYGLTPSEIAIIDRCVNRIYQPFINRYNFDKAHTPTFMDFHHMLECQPEREARDLATSFEIYAKGSLDVFAHQSNVDINNRFVVYDIKDIGSSIKKMAYLVVLDNIWNRIVANRKKGRRTWIYMDEVYILFEKEESTNFIRQIFSRGRKWGARTTAITQNVEPILDNITVTTMLSNSAFIQLLNQSPKERDILAALLHISPAQVSFIDNAPPGQGVLYIQGQGIIPFRDNISRQIAPNLYRVMTSKPDEMMEEFR